MTQLDRGHDAAVTLGTIRYHSSQFFHSPNPQKPIEPLAVTIGLNFQEMSLIPDKQVKVLESEVFSSNFQAFY